MEEKRYQSIEESIYTKTLANGLRLVVYPKKGFTKSYAVFTTSYGSIDNRFETFDGQEHIVADGIAHFLEHKLFEKEDVDVMNLFNEYGANTNAFTSFNQTSYLFSTSGDIEKPLHLLLDFVQQPFFSDESVEKEKGIIGEEIDMYNDDPGFRNYLGAIEQMYHEHPVKIDILGTRETIDKITKEQLYLCYNTFYHPSNMVLFVSGDVDVAKIEKLVEENQAQKTFPKPQLKKRIFPTEEQTVATKKGKMVMDVTQPKVTVGVKLPNETHGYSSIQTEIIFEILLEMAVGKGSHLNEKYMKEMVILEPMGYEVAIEPSYRHLLIGTEVSNVDYFCDHFFNDLNETLSQITSADFERIRNASLGMTLSSLNSLEFIANNYSKYIFYGADIFEAFDEMRHLTFADIQPFIKMLSESEHTMHIVSK